TRFSRDWSSDVCTSDLNIVLKAFEEHKIDYQIGGSFMLYLRGIKDTFKDIDIMIKEKDYVLVDALLSELGEKLEVKKDPMFITKIGRASCRDGGKVLDV